MSAPEREWDLGSNDEDETSIIDPYGISPLLDLTGTIGVGPIDSSSGTYMFDNRLTSGLRGPEPVLRLSENYSQDYRCPVHGVVDMVATFALDDEEETYCLRCWRDHIRAIMRPLIPNEGEQQNGREEV